MADEQLIQTKLKFSACLDELLDLFYCPYCDMFQCGGIYSEFNCPDMWSESDLAKLDARLDRRNGMW